MVRSPRPQITVIWGPVLRLGFTQNGQNSVQLVVAMGFTLGTSTALLNQRAVARLTDQNRRSRARMSFPVVENGSWVPGVIVQPLVAKESSNEMLCA